MNHRTQQEVTDEDEPLSPRPQRPSKSKEGRGSGRSKPRASYACLNCRQRKIKCMIDPVRKKCNSCRSLQIPCVVSRDGDRRKLASREHISSLQERLRYLEGVIAGQAHINSQPNQNYNLDPNEDGHINPQPNPNYNPDPHEDDHGFVDDDNPPGDFISPTTRHSENHRRESHHSFNGDGQQYLGPFDQSRQFSNGLVPNDEPSLNLNSTSDPILGPTQLGNVSQLNDISVDQQPPSPTERDSPRLDVDEESSQPRFYGPSSQRYIHDRTRRRESDLNGLSNDADADLNIDSSPVRSLLLQTFWKVQPLSQAIIDQMTFEMGRNAPARSQYYSEFLENAILANATRMVTSPGIIALGPKYAEKASSLVTQELQRPNVATLQGFLLLSDFEATRGRDRLGYMYAGIGCRMVFDLGLQESCSELISRGKLSPSEGLSRHILFLGAFVYDKLWSLYLGRPSSIPVSHLASAERRIAEQGWEIPATLTAWSGLATDISDLTEILNGEAPLDWQSLDALTQIDNRIIQRCASMPGHLQLNESRISDLPASAYGLNIQFRGIRIVLHKILSKVLTHNRSSLASPQRERIQHSRTIMRDNAISIARMVSVYQQIFGIENVITVMLDNMYVAAALLISHILRMEQHDPLLPPSQSTDVEVRWLRCLAEMLQKAEKHYPVTSGMRYTLSGFVSGTSLAGTFGSWASDGITQKDNLLPSMQTGDLFPGSFPGPNFGEQSDFLLQGPYDTDQGLIFSDMDGTTMNNMMSWILSPTEGVRQ